MTTRYREIEPVQEPVVLGIDKANFIQVAFNIDVIKGPSETFLEELVSILVTASVGVYNTNIFTTSRAIIPNDDGPYVIIIETGGTFPERTHNEINPPAWQRPSAQILVKAKSYASARAKAYDAYFALVGIRNQDITP